MDNLLEVGLKGGVVMLPVNSIFVSPIKVASSDPSIVRGAVKLSLELSGVIKSENYGWGYYQVDEEHAVGVAHIEEGVSGETLKRASRLDIAARLYGYGQNDFVACWKEQGQWTIGLYKKGRLLYAEVLNELLEVNNVVNILQSELLGKEIIFQPTHHFIWAHSEEEIDRLQSTVVGLGHYTVTKCPELVVPQPCEGSFQAESRYEEIQKQSKQSEYRMYILLALFVYIACAFTILYKKRKLELEVADLKKTAERLLPEIEKNDRNQKQVDELPYLLRGDEWALETYKMIYATMPPNQTLRLKVIEISPELIMLTCSAVDSAVLNRFFSKLKSDSYLGDNYTWTRTLKPDDSKTGLKTYGLEAVKN